MQIFIILVDSYRVVFVLYTGPSTEDVTDDQVLPETVHDAATGEAGRLHVGGARQRAGRGSRARRARHTPALLQAQDEERRLDQGAKRTRWEVPERIWGQPCLTYIHNNHFTAFISNVY